MGLAALKDEYVGNIEYSELELLRKAKQGNKHAEELLIKQYIPFAKSISCRYFVKGADRDDILQIALIAVAESIRSFDFQKMKMQSYKNFVGLCINRELITYVIKSKRGKNVINNEAASLDIQKDTDNNTEMSFCLKALKENTVPSPEDILIKEEYYREINESLNQKLTELEKAIFLLRFNGYSYKDISSKLGVGEKSIDNAIQRFKKKMKKILKRKK